MNTDVWFAVLASCFAFVSAAAAPDPTSWVTQADDDETPRRQITAELFLNNGLDWGLWGDADFCPEGSFAHAFEVKLELYSATDNTAVNAVKLYCSTPAEHDTGYAMSTEGRYGDWMGMRICETGHLTAMRANVLQSQGVLNDDVAVENVEMECNFGDEILAGVEDAKEERFELGEWSRWAHCFNGSAVCGIEIRYEEPYVGDDAAVTDLVMYCCDTAALDDEETAAWRVN
ncbi:vitelline membrane outer layer protein 1-like isoform X2 [Penaeus chinensis]|uniref:vitelline membrane outer layer protein 1-like isoform X2 n=1 Tax=Penaeus chinensis TaxID=139456 RepID=UPI001FB5D382|nr:vitelline membrane outer layer protein 1-like isoform X2 [Penaeus chinensis]